MLLKVIIAVIDIGLIILTAYLSSEILFQYISKDSSFSQSQVPITATPTVTICLSPFNIGIIITTDLRYLSVELFIQEFE